MRMGNRKIVMVAILLLLLSAGQTFAHPPSRVNMSYDSDGSVLEVTVSHPVSDPSSHYIEKFEVRLDGEKFCELELERQISNSDAMALFKLPPLNAGTEIEVEVYCSKFGERTARITVE